MVVEVWKNWKDQNSNETLANVTSKGYRAILAAPWYLNYNTYGKVLTCISFRALFKKMSFKNCFQNRKLATKNSLWRQAAFLKLRVPL